MMLVEAGADVNGTEHAPLTGAAAEGHNDVVKFLLGRGADVNAHDGEPLEIASRLGQAETCLLYTS